jgi:hypothetical protein
MATETETETISMTGAFTVTDRDIVSWTPVRITAFEAALVQQTRRQRWPGLARVCLCVLYTSHDERDRAVRCAKLRKLLLASQEYERELWNVVRALVSHAHALVGPSFFSVGRS